FSPNLIQLRNRIRAGNVQHIGYNVWTDDHYAGYSHSPTIALQHGDSLHRPPPRDVLPIIQWVFSDLPSTAILLPPPEITPGTIEQQRADAGSGSCFLAAQNFIEHQADPGVPSWIPEMSAQFRNKALREVVLYHLVTQAEGG
ncbi:hypothetical protein FB451DRAFT_990315, partial [Mycena latifolia]